MTEKRKTSVELMGQLVSFYTDLPEERLNRIVELVETTLEEVAEKTRSPLTHKTALLAMLSIAERNLDLNDQMTELKRVTFAKSEKILKALEGVVPPSAPKAE